MVNQKVMVIVTTMHATDASIYRKMNLTTDAIIANQANACGFYTDDEKIRMYTTDTRGLSRNRNVAITQIPDDVEYVIFADDDLIFVDAYEQLIYEEFKKLPRADAIKFNLQEISERKLSMKRIEKRKRARLRDITSSGVCALAIRKEALFKHGLFFRQYFGAGTEYYCGEDTIFLVEMLRKKLKLYLSPVCLAYIDQGESTWFRGYDEKYFKTAGMLLAVLYRRLAYVLAFRSAFRFSRRKKATLGFRAILKCYWQGIKTYFH